MAFICTEREFDWAVNLWAIGEMMPYIFACGHVNYARYRLYYLWSMEALPQEISGHFLKGNHTMRHGPASVDSTWSDMYIESTF